MNKEPQNIKINIDKEVDITIARQKTKLLAEQCGFNLVDQTRIVTAVSEITRNALVFARKGIIEVITIDNGLEIIVKDNGPGIEDISLAMTDGFSTAKSLGIGLPGTKRLMDYFDIESAPGKGTTVIIRKYNHENK